MIERVTGRRRLPDEVADEIIAKTDGVPLFLEELTKMVLESGMLQERSGRYELRERLIPLDIPVTLQDSLMARLDRLDDAKEVAQLGATLGREFRYALIRAVSPLAEEALLQGLRRLVDSELIHQKDLPPQASYAFKHVLIQNAAYPSLLRRKRQGYHRSIARALRQQFPEVAEAHPELLAYYCTEAATESGCRPGARGALPAAGPRDRPRQSRQVPGTPRGHEPGTATVRRSRHRLRR